MNINTTDKVQVGDPTVTSAGTSTSITWHCPYVQPRAEQGWECPRCGRINAPWVRQCDCSRNNWTYKPDWWKKVTCNSDTFRVHPDSTVYQVGGSDYKEGNTYVNVSGTQSNKVKPNITAWNGTDPNIAANDSTTYRTDVPTTLTNSIDNLQKQLDSNTLCDDISAQIRELEERVNKAAKATAYNNSK